MQIIGQILVEAEFDPESVKAVLEALKEAIQRVYEPDLTLFDSIVNISDNLEPLIEGYVLASRTIDNMVTK